MSLTMLLKSISFTLVVFTLTLVTVFTNSCHSVYLDEAQAVQNLNANLNADLSVKPVRIGLLKSNNLKSLDEVLARAFIKDYGLKSEFIIYNSIRQLNDDLKNKKINIAVSRSYVRDTKEYAARIQAYDEIQTSLFCRGDEITKIYWPNNFNFANSEFIKIFPHYKDKINFVDLTFENAVKSASQHVNDCFVAESKYANSTLLSNLKFKRVWTSDNLYPVSWLVGQEHTDLIKLAGFWFHKLDRDNKISRFKDQFEAPYFKMSALQYRRFKMDILEKLPEWKKHFQEYSIKYQIPWTLIAAVAYQESHWDSEAVSYTGVKGFMQITSETATHLGLTDREDPLQSIQGGAYYLKYLFEKTPKHLTTYERWVQALAAYNVGWAHMLDVYRLAKQKNMDPYRWKNLKNLLPELSNDEHASLFLYGQARGDETVDFVENVLNYNKALNQIFTQPLLTSRDF